MIARTLISFLLLFSYAVAQEPVHPFNAVPKIHVWYPEGGAGVGSGTLIGVKESKGLVYTCAHLWDNGRQVQEITVTFSTGIHHANVLKFNREKDLALLEISRPKGIKPVPMGCPTKTYIVGGHGGDRGLRFMRGAHYLNGENQSGTMKYMVIDANVHGGDSGGPVFNENGEMISVLWGNNDQGTWAADHQIAMEFCEEWLSQDYVTKQAAIVRRTQCYNGQCYNGYGGSANGWRSVPSTQPSRGTAVPYYQPLDRKPAVMVPAPKPKQPRQATPSCNCKVRLAQLEADVKALKQKPGTPGPAGPKGDPGPPGKDGKDGSNADPETIANLVLASLDERLTNIEIRLEDNDEQEPREGVVYYRVVADQEADYWRRIGDYYESAAEAYSQIKVVPPPDFPVGQMPQMVAYQSGVPLGAFRGSYEVENALASISRGNAPLPQK